MKGMKKKRFVHEFVLLFLLALAVGAIILQSHYNPGFTGYVVGLQGQTCDGTWVNTTDWSVCANGNQTRTLVNITDSTNCASPLTEYQACTIINSTNIYCTENWQWSNWSTCVNGNQTKTYSDLASCGNVTTKLETQTCTADCVESWTCGDWATCASNSQTRTCTDAASCGTTTSKPAESQTCTCVENWSYTNWTECSNGNKTRTATDANSCGTENTKPSIIHSCAVESSSVTSNVIETLVCSPNWQCGDWQECVGGNQIRACTDINNCGTSEGLHETTQACVEEIKETCSDKIKNQDETGVDCGGVCKRCSIFTIVGSVISGPVGQVGTFFSNKTNVLIVSGVLGFLVAGFFVFRFFSKHKIKITSKE